ncbi:hypothetical protein HD806DRAFT_528105 [Xylariaceae sp. AK1471]|nr:hypothetical protein HD806DRAFT_528105 [Xylariaceae sp. AK1471]
MPQRPLGSPRTGDGDEDGIITIRSLPSTGESDNRKDEIKTAQDYHPNSANACDDSFTTTPDASSDSDDSYASNEIFGSNLVIKKYFPGECDTMILKHVEEKTSQTSMSRGHKAASYSALESLPAEMRIEILLSMPDLRTLHSIIRASPTMLSQFLLDRHKILSACLERELGDSFVDAYANMKSRPSELGSPRTNSMVTDFLDSYEGWTTGSDSCPEANSLTPYTVQWMVDYHNSVARPLARRYSFWALENLQNEAVSSLSSVKLATPRNAKRAYDGHSVEISRSEEIRIFRALYRCETYHNLFGYNAGIRHGGLPPYKVNDIFFNLFAPWEAEAVGCIDAFARQQYEDIFQKVRVYLHPRHPRFRAQLQRQLQYENVFDQLQEYLDPRDRKPQERHYLYLPKGSFDLDNRRHDYLDGIVSRGLKMLARLLIIDDRQTLVSKMERRLRIYSGEEVTIPETMNAFNQMERRRTSTNFPNAMDVAERYRDPLEFLGDSTRLNGPPLAWVLLWGGKYANINGALVPESLKRLGYVMWDESRWGCPGARAFIAKQWKKKPQSVQYIKEHCNWSPLDV